MIDELGFDTSNPFGLFEQNGNLLPPIQSPPPPHRADEAVSSYRSSNRKLRALHLSHATLASNPVKETEDSQAALHVSISEAESGPPSPSSNQDELSADLRKYFFEKLKKKGIHDAEKVYDQYLQMGLSPKAAIALTDRSFFPNPHEKDHGNYLKNVIGEELFKKEQAARKGKEDWLATQVPETLDDKIHTAALQALEASLDKSNLLVHGTKGQKFHKSEGLGGYLVGIAEIVAGGAIMVAGGALEIATCGGFTVGLGITMGTGASLIGLGLATTAANAKDLSMPNLPKYDPLLDIVNKPKEKPKNWDEPGAPPVRGDQLVGDGKTSPGQGFDEWRGCGEPGSHLGGWVRGQGKSQDSLHPDLDHDPPYGPHWDYHGPGFDNGARIYPNGTWEPKR